MKINELEKGKYYACKTTTCRYIFQFKGHTPGIFSAEYIHILYNKMLRKDVGYPNYTIEINANNSIMLDADEEFNLISDSVGDKVFKLLSIGLITTDSLLQNGL